MRPRPWSYSALDDFDNCPRAYHEKKVVKSVVEEPGEQQLWGIYVHKAFEDRQRDGVVLPADLEQHEPFMAKLQAAPGVASVESQVAFSRDLKPCGFFAPDVWWRGVIDFRKVAGNQAMVVDYKTGKVKNKYDQLEQCVIQTFIAHPEVSVVRVAFYWTVTGEPGPSKDYTREDIPAIWARIVPKLKQYAEAFKTDTWQPRQSGLCKGWCPVTQCEFWQPKRIPR
jgi:hypothetical protein